VISHLLLQVVFALTLNAVTIASLEGHVMCIQALQQRSDITVLKRRLASSQDLFQQQQVCMAFGACIISRQM